MQKLLTYFQKTEGTAAYNAFDNITFLTNKIVSVGRPMPGPEAIKLFIYSAQLSIKNCAQICWLVGCFGLNSPLIKYFSLYQAVSQREGERKRNDRRKKTCLNNPHPHLLQAQKALPNSNPK